MGMAKRLVGSIIGDGAVLMNDVRPRPARETAVGPLADGPYAYFSVMGLEKLSVSVRVTSGTITIALQVTNEDPATGTWNQVDIGSSLTTGDLLVASGAFRFARVLASGATPGTAAAVVEFYGEA
jgi:hypothetical protein